MPRLPTLTLPPCTRNGRSSIEINPMVLRILRVSRALRILRVLQGKNAGDLRDLLHALIASGPAMANVASILSLVMVCIAVTQTPYPPPYEGV